MMRFAAIVALLGLAGVAGAQTTAVPTLKAKTRIVPIDIVVTDKEGRPVKGLQASDFALTENGAAQTIDHFEVHTSLSAEDAAKLPVMPKLDANIFTNYSTAPANGPLTVIVFDALNTKMSDQSVVLKQMQKYLDTPHPGMRVELFELNDGLRLVQGFTSDPEVLRAVLATRKAAPQASGQMDKADSDEATQITRHDLIAPATQLITNIMSSAGPGNDLNFNRGGPAGFQLWQRQTKTLDAMAGLARYLGTLPGRKNLLWFSASFAIPKSWPDVTQKLHETMALLASSQVSVYPIVAYGLMPDLNTMWSPTGLLKKTDAEYTTMDMVAQDTGGKVFMNSNDIAGAAKDAIEDGSNYYTLTYTPTNKDWKGEFRKVQVKLAEKGYALAYRPGYYADDADEKAPGKAKSVVGGSAGDAAKVALHRAMEYGSPQPTDVVFKAAVNPATGHVERVVARRNSLSPKVEGPFERYVVSVAALPGDFTFVRRDDGKVHVGAEMVTCVYSAEGGLENVAAIRIDEDVDDARYRTIVANGMKFEQEISVPVKGESFLRIGVEDLATHRVGVVEIPVETMAKLKPLAASAAAQK